jgi:hypothetical protein
MSEIRRKLIIIGDGTCRKTCLLNVCFKRTIPEVWLGLWVMISGVMNKCLDPCKDVCAESQGFNNVIGGHMRFGST